MDALAEKLDARLRESKPETAAEARERITEVIELADHDMLDNSLPRRVPSSSFRATTLIPRDLSSLYVPL